MWRGKLSDSWFVLVSDRCWTGADFSGSTFCGNRLHVIDVGTEISGKGQSLENAARQIQVFAYHNAAYAE